MAVTDPLILPADVLLIPVADLAPEVRKQFEAEDDDYAITRPRSRAPSKIVDATVAALLGEFRKPKTIVDAVISYSHAHAADPDATLEAAFPVLDRFIRARILVPAASQEAQRIDPVYRAGDRVDGFELIGSVQVLDDSDLYKARADDGTQAALKIARPGREREMRWSTISSVASTRMVRCSRRVCSRRRSRRSITAWPASVSLCIVSPACETTRGCWRWPTFGAHARRRGRAAMTRSTAPA